MALTVYKNLSNALSMNSNIRVIIVANNINICTIRMKDDFFQMHQFDSEPWKNSLVSNHFQRCWSSECYHEHHFLV